MRSIGPRGGRGSGQPASSRGRSFYSRYALVLVLLGVLVGYLLLNMMLHSDSPLHIRMDLGREAIEVIRNSASSGLKHHKWPGDSIHSVLTSSGDDYQNYQTRIMYATYQMVQKEPGGERLTGFTRILHSNEPDILMRIVPTWHAWDVHNPSTDGYPVAARPPAIQQWIAAATANASMVQGAWVVMLECDYVWMRPLPAPGDAYDPHVPGVQFLYDYILPQHPDAVPWMQKLFPGGNVSTIPASGPAPVMLRFSDWQLLGPEYARRSAAMEADKAMTNALKWVREMYAWDVAVAMHADKVKVLTLKYPETTLIVQPPFDEGLANASLCHYTWGPIYYEGGSTKGKCIYKWEKREFREMKYVVDVPLIPMPPEYRDGLTLTFEAKLTRPRHELVVLMLTQINMAIKTLPNIQAELDYLDDHALPEFLAWRDKELAKRKASGVA